MQINKYWLILILITLIAFFPRALQVFNPYNYFFDPEQGTEYLVTKSIVVDHQIVLTAHQGGFGGFSKGSGFNYLLAIPFILSGGNPFGGRLFMLIISLLTVPLAFIFANRMFGLRSATLISFLLAISPNLIDYAGGISPPFVIPLLTVFFIYFLFKEFNGQGKFIPLLALIVGLMAHFEMATAGILFSLLILTGIICLIKKTIPYRYYFFSIIFFTLPILPILFFDITHNFANVKGIFKMLEMSKPQISLVLNNALDNRLEVFNWNFVSTFSPNPVIWIPVLVLILFGIYRFTNSRKGSLKEKTFALYLGLIPIFTFLILLIYPGNVINQWWISNLTVIYCFTFGIFLNYFWSKSKLKLLVIALIIILSIAFIKRTLFIYITQFIYPPVNYIKEVSAIEYIFENTNKKTFGIIVFAKRDLANYDYLIWWLGNTKYKYQPYKAKKGLYYIIIEPNYYPLLNAPITLNSLRSGELLETKKLPNGFIIEKRLVKQ